jgi:putative endopeptidase
VFFKTISSLSTFALRHSHPSAILRNRIILKATQMKMIPRLLPRLLPTTLAVLSTVAFADTSKVVTSPSLPDKPGVDTVYFDTKAAPCDDFYRYATGHWQDASTIPKDKARWGAFDQIGERSREVMIRVLRDSAASKSAADTVRQKLADFYKSGMNAEQINLNGPKIILNHAFPPLRHKLSVAERFALMQQEGTPVGFNFAVRQDQRDSSRYIMQISQGGLGLPEREYYFANDERSVKLRQKYIAHIGNMLRIGPLGLTKAVADQAAVNIMALETKLAEAAMTRVEARDPDKTYNLMTLSQLQQHAPQFDWAAFFNAAGVEKVGDINVAQPNFFKSFATFVADIPIETWGEYRQWHTLRAMSPYMGGEYEKENFAFYGKELTGVDEMESRERRITATIDRTMGDALGKLYVEKAFSPTAKAKALDLVKNVRAAMRDRIEALDWMSAETKKEATVKLDAIAVKIGYPDKWKDYSAVEIKRDDYLGNIIRATRVEFQRQVDRLGKPIDRNAWSMSPPTVNAYYNSSINEIVFPAGILQSPFFDEKADDASNYGGIGMVIGHELTHGFDDRGRKFDAIGNRRDWWTAEDATRYTVKADAIAKQYEAYQPLPGVSINGRATLGENIADFGGLRVAYLGMQKAIANNAANGKKMDGLAAEQRFFINYAQSWRQNVREAELRRRLLTDTHSPAQYRVLGPLGNLPEFQQAFGCKAGDRMVRAAGDQVTVW